MACKYLVDGQLFTQEELTSALRAGTSFKETPQLVDTGEAPISKYDVLAGLSIQSMLGNLKGTPAQIFKDYRKDFDSYGITQADIEAIQDTPAPAAKPKPKAKKAEPKVSEATPKADIPVATQAEKKAAPKLVPLPNNIDPEDKQIEKTPPARKEQLNKSVVQAPNVPTPPSVTTFRVGNKYVRRGKEWTVIDIVTHPDGQTYIHFEVQGSPFVETIRTTEPFLQELESVRSQKVQQEFYAETDEDVNMAETIQSALGRKLNTNTHKTIGKLDKVSAPWRMQIPGTRKSRLNKGIAAIKKAIPNIDIQFSDLTKIDGREIRTPDGRVYGAVVDGVIHLDPRVATIETPFHEMGHIWVSAARISNPELYTSILGAVNGSKYHQIIKQDPNYAGLSPEQQLEEAFALAFGKTLSLKARTPRIVRAIQSLLDWISQKLGLGYNLNPSTPLGDLIELADISIQAGKPLVEMTSEDIAELDPMDTHRMMISALHLSNKNRIQDILMETIEDVGTKFADKFNGELDPSVKHVSRIPSTQEHDLYAVDTREGFMSTADPEVRKNLKFVSSSILKGKTVNFTIADSLRTGKIPGTDVTAKGGILFPFMDINIKNGFAWASIGQAAATQITNAGTDFTVVTMMDRTALYSNEAALRRGIKAIKALPAAKQKQLLREYNKSMYDGKGVPVKERKDLEKIGPFESWDQLYETVIQQGVKLRATAFTHIFPAGTNITPGLKYTELAVRLGLPTQDSIYDELSEPGAEHIPVGYASLVIKTSGKPVDMRAEYAKYGMKKEDVHPNYPFYIPGEVVGLLEDAMPAYLLSDDYAAKMEAATGRMDSDKNRLYSQAAIVNTFTTSLMHAGASNSFHINDADTSVSRFFTYLTGAFPNVNVKLSDNSSAREEILARQEGITTSASTTVYGFIDEEGTLNVAHKHLSPQSAAYHIARVYTAFLRKTAPHILQRGIDLVKSSPNPYFSAYEAAYKKQLPADTIAEMALAHFVADRGAAFLYNSLGVDAAYFNQYPEWVLMGEREAAAAYGKYSKLKDQAAKAKFLTAKNDVIFNNVRQYRARFDEWENTMMATIASIQGIEDVPADQMASMTLEDYSESFFSSFAKGRPIEVGEHSTLSYTSADLARAREVDSVRYQHVQDTNAYDNADRVIALTAAVSMENENSTPGDIFESTSWYRNTFGAWTFDPDKKVPAGMDVELVGYENMSRIDRAKALLATTDNVDKVDRTLLGSRLEEASPSSDGIRPLIPNPEGMRIVDEHIDAQHRAGLPLDLDALQQHPATDGVSMEHLQVRAELIRNGIPVLERARLTKKYERADKAPKTFHKVAPAVLGERTNKAESVGNTHFHANPGSLSLAADVLGGNPYQAVTDGGFYMNGEIHMTDPGQRKRLQQEEALDNIGRSSDALQEIYDEFKVTPGFVDSGDIALTLTDPSNIVRLKSVPANILKALQNAAQRLGFDVSMDSGIAKSFQKWLTKASTRSFQHAFSEDTTDVRFSVYSEEGAGQYQQDVLADILQNPDIDPVSWLTLLADDLYSGKLNRDQFDDFMNLRQAMLDGHNIKTTPTGVPETTEAAQEIGKYYNEREAFMAGEYEVANRYIDELEQSFTREELEGLTGTKATNLRELMTKAARHPLANPVNAMNYAHEWLLLPSDERAVNAVQQLAMGLARKKVSATIAFLETELLLKDDPKMRADLRQAKEMEKTMSAALVGFGSAAGLALGARNLTVPTGLELSFDDYFEQVESELFRDNSRNARTGNTKYKFTIQEKAELRKMYEDARKAEQGIQNLQREMGARLDKIVAEQAVQTIRLWRAKRTPLSNKEIEAITEALRASEATETVRKAIAGSPLVGQRLNYIRALAESVIAADPTIASVTALHAAVAALAPNVTVAEINQVLVYSNPNSTQAIVAALEQQRTNIARMENAFATIRSKMNEVAIASQTGTGDVPGLMSEIGTHITKVLGIMAGQGSTDPQFLAAYHALHTAYNQLNQSLVTPANGNATIDANRLAVALAATADARNIAVGTRGTREAKLDALIDRARRGDMSVIAELAPKPVGVLTPEEAALKARLFEKRRALKNFYEAHKSRTWAEALSRGTTVLSNTYRTFAASLDLSMVFIQSWPSFARLFNPIRIVNQLTGRNKELQQAADALGRGIKAAWQEARYGNEAETLIQYSTIQSHPLYGYAVSAGVEFTTPKTIGGIEEELFRESLIDIMAEGTGKMRASGIAGGAQLDGATRLLLRGRNASEAVFLTYLNLIRIETFNAGYQALKKSAPGYAPTVEDLQNLAAFVNTNTGRSHIPEGLRGIEGFLWAAKLAVSPFKFMINAATDPIKYGIATAKRGRGTAEEQLANEVRRQNFKFKMTYGWGTLLGAGAMIALGRMAVRGLCNDQESFSTDPRNGDFMKIRCGTRGWAPLGPLTSASRFAAQFAVKSMETFGFMDQKVTPRNKFFNSMNIWEIISRFYWGKASPGINVAISTASGQDFKGDPTAETLLGKLVTPSSEYMAPIAVAELAEIAMSDEAADAPLLATITGLGVVLGLGYTVGSESSKNRDNTVNQYLETKNYEIPNMNMGDKRLQKKNNPKLYGEAKEEYILSITGWISERIKLGASPSEAQIKSQARRLNKQLKQKYLQKAAE